MREKNLVLIYFDTNTLVEMMLNRSRAEQCYQHFIRELDGTAASIMTLQFIMHHAEHQKIDLNLIRKSTNRVIWLPLGEEDMQWAYEHYNGKDFEDGLQMAVAVNQGCKEFVTIDKKLAKKYADHIKIKLIV